MSGSGQGYLYTPEDQEAESALRRRQAYAQALMQQGSEDPGRGAYGGLRNAGNSILGAFLANRADTAEKTLAKGAQERRYQMISAMLKGEQPQQQTPAPAAPSGPSGPLPVSPMASPGDVDQTIAPVPQTPQEAPRPGQPGQVTMPAMSQNTPTPGPAYNDALIRAAAMGDPMAIQMIQTQQARQNKLWENQNIGMSLADRQQAQQNLQNQENLSQFNNRLDPTKQQQAELAIQRGGLGVQQGNLAETRRYHDQMSGMGLTENGAANPVVQSWMGQVASGNATLQNVPLPMRSAVAMAINNAPKTIFSPLAAQRNTLASSRITHPYTNMAAYKLTADGLPYLQRIDAAMKTPGSVSDQDMLDSLTKLNTGGNAVTDAQVKLITDGKSYADWAGTIGNKFANGGVLSNNQRQQIKEIANHIFENYKKGYQPVYEDAKSKLQAAGIPEPFWTIPDLNKLNAGQEIGNISPPSAGGNNPNIGKPDPLGLRK